MSKITYWKCVECGSMVTDLNMHEFDDSDVDTPLHAEFCYGCMDYNVDVVIAYD
jgi:hypothetical protein